VAERQLHRILNPLELSWLIAVVGKQELPRGLSAESTPNEQLSYDRVQI
jgi:hypothetical protein